MEDTSLETHEAPGSGYNLLLVGRSLTLHYDTLR